MSRAFRVPVHARLLPAFALCAALAPGARAATVCAGDANAIMAAITTWRGMDSGDMTIKVVQGTYALPGSGFLDQNGAASLSILGGYKPGTNCAQRVLDAPNTVLDGGNAGSVNWSFGLKGDITLEGLTFAHMRRGLTLYQNDFEDGTGHTFAVRYSIFRDFQVDDSIGSVMGGIYIDGTGDGGSATVSFKNNLVHDITMLTAARPPVAVISGNDASATVAYNTFTSLSGPVQVEVYQPSNAGAAFLVNNILWNGAATAFTVNGFYTGPYASYNIMGPTVGTLLSNTANVNADPKFVDAANHDYHLQNTSPAVNSGGPSNLVIGGYPSRDLDGGARVVGSKIDRGAYESAVDDLNDFKVTSTLDASHATNPNVNCNAGSTTCTLREAMIRANSNAGASKISFGIACPSLLQLGSTLPDITSDVTIDGYTNPGATMNSSYAGFDANLCVYVNGNGAAARAIHTTSGGRVTVQGLGFAGFTSEAVLIDAGTGHSVSGNQFGGIAFAAANQNAIRVTGAAGTVFIGGYDSPAVRNLIVNAVSTGITIDSTAGKSSVGNNLIGIGPDGHTTNGNGIGVYVFNSPGNVIEYNNIGGNTGAGIVLAGPSTHDTIVQYNRIGYATDDTTLAQNGGAAVQLTFGATGNLIGASGNGTGGGNLINSVTSGVQFTASAGSGNRVLANAPFIAGGAGVPIDLGAIGPTPNDGSDLDGGPNSTQNYPVVMNAFRTPTAEWIEVSLDTIAGDSFRLDLYWDTCCSGLGSPPRGSSRKYVARSGTPVTNGVGHSHQWIKLAPLTGSLGAISATATSAAGDTSEFGPYAAESGDMVFRDDFDH